MALLRTTFSKNAPRLRPRHVPRRLVLCEKWLPRLAEKHGIAAHSISLRGTAGSPCVEKSIKLSTHAADVAEAIALQLPEKQLALCAHSFGGPVAIDALATDENLAGRCAGLALLCSVPPSGTSPARRAS